MDRRDFLRCSALGTAAAMWPLPSGAQTPPLREGIYTDRLTYHAGVDPLQIHCSLLDVTTVDVQVLHLDHLPSPDLVAFNQITVDGTQTTEYAGEPSGGVGIYGPEFPVRLSLDTTGWEPGLYMIYMPADVMRPENRTNQSGSQGFISQNHVVYFVVTSDVPGAYADILWILDCGTGTAYGGFGGESIYGGTAASVRTVSTRRPGLDRAAWRNRFPATKLRNDGYLFEYMDALAFGEYSGPMPWNLIVVVGQFEYLSHGFMQNLKSHVDAGGNLLLAANEFGVYRTRIGPDTSSLTTYKHAAGTEDPISGVEQAGVGMLNPSSIYESEIAGTTLFSGWNNGFVSQDMTITASPDLGWLFEGTSFTDTLPALVNGFAVGSRGVLSGNSFSLMDTGLFRTPAGTEVWAAAPMPNARKWDEGAYGQDPTTWPQDPDGHATCTIRESNGARVIGLPQPGLVEKLYDDPEYGRLLENMFAYLAANEPAPPPHVVPSIGTLGAGALAGALVASSVATKSRP